MKKFTARLSSQKGQGTVEYALIVIATVLIISAVLLTNPSSNALGKAITDSFNKIGTAVGKVTV